MKESSTGLTAVLTAGLLIVNGCAPRQFARLQEPAVTSLAETAAPEPQPYPDESIEAKAAPSDRQAVGVKTAPARDKIIVAKAASPRSETVVTDAPPTPHVEVVGAPPGAEYVWMPGVWQWHGAWVWAPGRWGVPPRPNAVWVTGQWTRTGQSWTWIRGYWR
jgi:hypothetical protein